MKTTLKQFILSKCRIYGISPVNMFKKHRYYIIRRKPPGAGFFSNYIYVLTHILYAEDKGWAPVVDMARFKTLYSEPDLYHGTDNAWEYYYHQPDDALVKEAYQSHNYIISDFTQKDDYYPYNEENDQFVVIPDRFERMLKAAEKVELKPYIQDMLQQKYTEHFAGNTVLAVHYRGTDRHTYHRGHYYTPELLKYLDVTQAMLDKHPDINRIFLCTDEEDATKVFNERFPGMVFWNKATRGTTGSVTGVHLEKNSQPGHHYNLGIEVIMDAYLMATCDYLIHSHSNVTSASVLFNKNQYKDRYFIPSK